MAEQPKAKTSGPKSKPDFATIGGLLLGTGWSALWLCWWERREAP